MGVRFSRFFNRELTMTPDEIAGENLAVLATYGRATYDDLEKRCRADNGVDKITRRNMRTFLINHGLALEVAPGHSSSAPGKGKGVQAGTTRFVNAVAAALQPPRVQQQRRNRGR